MKCSLKATNRRYRGGGDPTQTLLSHNVWKLHCGRAGGAVQSGVVNQNESRDLGNTNTNIVLTNTTSLESLIKTQKLPFQDSRTKGSIAYVCQLHMKQARHALLRAIRPCHYHNFANIRRM